MTRADFAPISASRFPVAAEADVAWSQRSEKPIMKREKLRVKTEQLLATINSPL
jgi:hypothetical protein